MARSAYKITLLLLWVVLVREVLTQSQTLPETAAPELQGMLLGSRYNEESENDADEMGRDAAQNMGALMASAPIKIFRSLQTTNNNEHEDNGRQELGGYGNAREAEVNPSYDCISYNDALQRYPSAQPSGRSAVPRTIPLAPLPTLPIIPGISPVPLLSPLVQSLTNLGRLNTGFGARPLLRSPLPYKMPALRTPLTYTMPALRAGLPTYQIPRMNKVWIPPSPPRARSSFTPNNYARSANQYKPLVFYV